MRIRRRVKLWVQNPNRHVQLTNKQLNLRKSNILITLNAILIFFLFEQYQTYYPLLPFYGDYIARSLSNFLFPLHYIPNYRTYIDRKAK